MTRGDSNVVGNVRGVRCKVCNSLRVRKPFFVLQRDHKLKYVTSCRKHMTFNLLELMIVNADHVYVSH